MDPEEVWWREALSVSKSRTIARKVKTGRCENTRQMCIGACSRARTMCIEKTRIIKPHITKFIRDPGQEVFRGGGGHIYTRDRAQIASREWVGGEYAWGKKKKRKRGGSLSVARLTCQRRSDKLRVYLLIFLCPLEVSCGGKQRGCHGVSRTLGDATMRIG
jgi:hypothetical protein